MRVDVEHLENVWDAIFDPSAHCSVPFNVILMSFGRIPCVRYGSSLCKYQTHHYSVYTEHTSHTSAHDAKISVSFSTFFFSLVLFSRRFACGVCVHSNPFRCVCTYYYNNCKTLIWWTRMWCAWALPIVAAASNYAEYAANEELE